MTENMLEVKNVSKLFGTTKALDELSFQVKRGEIYGLIGANGSGKSTLMNILFGNSLIRETGGYTGDIMIDGSVETIRSSSEAIQKGIGMIHQEFILIPDMSVTENVKLTRENTRNNFTKLLGRKYTALDRKKDTEETKAVLDRLGFELDTTLYVRNISINAKQFVEIAREIQRTELKILFLDEPTAVLNTGDANRLLEILRELADSGVTIIFCSHRLHEICEICDRVLVIRDGVRISEYEKSEMNVKKLAHDMVGYEVMQANQRRELNQEEVILSFQDFTVAMPGEHLEKLNLDIYKGEVLGVASLSGHGKFALGYGVMGMHPTAGDVYYEGQKIDVNQIQKSIENGIFLLPDDRKQMGLLLKHSVKDNILFSSIYSKKGHKKHLLGILKRKEKIEMKNFVEQQREQLEIKCESINQKVEALSGGNQQKVCIARVNAMAPKVLFVMEPTRGVDVGAKEKILDMLVKMSTEMGMTVVVISSELEELKRISDRIVVLCEGKHMKILSPDTKEEQFALAYTGENDEE